MTDANEMASFLQELQAMDSAVKKRVLIIATVVIMIIVIGVWAVYFNSIVTGSQQPATASVGTAAPSAAPAGPSFWQRIESGFASFANIFKGPANYSIQPKP